MGMTHFKVLKESGPWSYLVHLKPLYLRERRWTGSVALTLNFDLEPSRTETMYKMNEEY